jgi:hypothetical protein
MTFLFSALLLLAACQLIKDAAEVTFSTELTSLMLVTVTGTKSAEVSSEINALNFSKSQVLSLDENTDIEPYVDKLREIEITSVSVEINGLTEGQVINTLSLDVVGVGNIATITNITPLNIEYTPTIDQAKLAEAGNKLKNDKNITLLVYGDANVPMSFNINMLFPVDVVAGALD